MEGWHANNAISVLYLLQPKVCISCLLKMSRSCVHQPGIPAWPMLDGADSTKLLHSHVQSISSSPTCTPPHLSHKPVERDVGLAADPRGRQGLRDLPPQPPVTSGCDQQGVRAAVCARGAGTPIEHVCEQQPLARIHGSAQPLLSNVEKQGASALLVWHADLQAPREPYRLVSRVSYPVMLGMVMSPFNAGVFLGTNLAASCKAWGEALLTAASLLSAACCV